MYKAFEPIYHSGWDGLKWLEANHLEAYRELPGCYREDTCLRFYIDVNGNLIATGVPGDDLSRYEWIWEPEANRWLSAVGYANHIASGFVSF